MLFEVWPSQSSSKKRTYFAIFGQNNRVVEFQIVAERRTPPPKEEGPHE